MLRVNSMWERPDTVTFLDDVPAIREAARLEDHEHDDQSAEQDIHARKNDLPAELREPVAQNRARRGDELLQQPDHDGSDDGAEYRAHAADDQHADIPDRHPQRELVG